MTGVCAPEKSFPRLRSKYEPGPSVIGNLPAENHLRVRLSTKASRTPALLIYGLLGEPGAGGVYALSAAYVGTATHDTAALVEVPRGICAPRNIHLPWQETMPMPEKCF